jgi:uncharacterized membrane protein
MKRAIALGLLVLFMAGACFADYVSMVKYTKNKDGIYCYEIPREVEKKLGFKAIAVKWLEDRSNDIIEVSLKLSARKEGNVDTVYFSYGWQPEWVWGIEKGSKAVIPINARARDWMKGKI